MNRPRIIFPFLLVLLVVACGTVIGVTLLGRPLDGAVHNAAYELLGAAIMGLTVWSVAITDAAHDPFDLPEAGDTHQHLDDVEVAHPYDAPKRLAGESEDDYRARCVQHFASLYPMGA